MVLEYLSPSKNYSEEPYRDIPWRLHNTPQTTTNNFSIYSNIYKTYWHAKCQTLRYCEISQTPTSCDNNVDRVGYWLLVGFFPYSGIYGMYGIYDFQSFDGLLCFALV